MAPCVQADCGPVVTKKEAVPPVTGFAAPQACQQFTIN